MAFSFSSLFSELSPSGESRKMRKKWPHNHANQIRTWCLKGKILNCEMIHKKVSKWNFEKEKKNKNLCVLHFFQELDIFSWKWFSTSMTREKCEAYTFTYEIRYHQILTTYLLFLRNFLLHRVFLVKNQFQWPQEVGGMSNVFSFTSRDTYKLISSFY